MWPRVGPSNRCDDITPLTRLNEVNEFLGRRQAMQANPPVLERPPGEFWDDWFSHNRILKNLEHEHSKKQLLFHIQ